eukprot:TRINITY_DN65_c0_g1_i3.p1 TRINITY_DN65_c0_g1~~TRINITY_DN65_c0_g1_i3.p1  ORF type:complete len:130 (-),score=4.32 TRINITY_DN65_c0_g1_i3:232-621(-)
MSRPTMRRSNSLLPGVYPVAVPLVCLEAEPGLPSYRIVLLLSPRENIRIPLLLSPRENNIADLILAGQALDPDFPPKLKATNFLFLLLAILFLLLGLLSNKCVTGLEWPASLRRPLNCPRCFLDKPRPR